MLLDPKCKQVGPEEEEGEHTTGRAFGVFYNVAMLI